MSDVPRILIVDDEPALLRIVARVLSTLDAEIDTAENGLRALEKMQATSYDLVISDVRMPGVDGAQLLQRAVEQKLFRGAFIILTGHADYTVEHLLKLGADEVLKKPLSREALVEVAKRFLEVGRTRRTNG